MSAFGSMHWTLVEFPSRLIVTSDHPIVQWAASGGAWKPAPTPLNVGVMENLEVRVPISPELVIVMTWRDLPDDDPNVIKGTRQHAANLKAFTIAEADRQWFHHPDSATPTTSGELLPLAPQLFRGYGLPVAAGSRRRARCRDHERHGRDHDGGRRLNDELVAAGLALDRNGRWHDPAASGRVRAAFGRAA